MIQLKRTISWAIASKVYVYEKIYVNRKVYLNKKAYIASDVYVEKVTLAAKVTVELNPPQYPFQRSSWAGLNMVL